jgi:hypothetical protein
MTWLMALPMAHGTSACASIQATPKIIPSASVPDCPPAIHLRNLAGERVSGTPGST